MEQSFILFPLDQVLPQISFMLPKIKEIRQGQKQVSLQQIVDLSLSVVNQAYKLTSINDRFYVLLVALRKFIECSLF